MSKSTVSNGRRHSGMKFYKRSACDYWIKDCNENSAGFLEIVRDFKKALLLTFDLECIDFLSTDFNVLRTIRTTLGLLPDNHQKKIIRIILLNQPDVDFKICMRYLSVFPKKHPVHIQILDFLKKHTVPLVLNSNDPITLQDIFRLEGFVNLGKIKSEFEFRRYLRCDDYLPHIYFLSRITRHKEDVKLTIRRLVIAGLNFEEKNQLLILLLNIYTDNIQAQDFEVNVFKDTVEEIHTKLLSKITPFKLAQLQKYKHLLYTIDNFNFNIFKGVSPEVAKLEPLIRDLVLKIHA